MKRNTKKEKAYLDKKKGWGKRRRSTNLLNPVLLSNPNVARKPLQLISPLSEHYYIKNAQCMKAKFEIETKIKNENSKAMSRILFSSSRNRCAVSISSLKSFFLTRRLHSGRPMRSAASSNNPLLPQGIPTSRSWSPYLIPGAVIGGIGSLVFFVHYNDERRAIPKGQEVKFQRSAIEEGPIIGGPFSLIDAEGRVVTERSLLGNWVLLYFGYTSSPDVGPAEVQKMAKAVNALESKQNLRVLPIFVTLDPQRDTPSQLRAYLREFDQRIVGLTGPVSSIRQMAQEYRVFFRKVDEEGDDYLVECSHSMYLLNPKMDVVKCFGVEYSAEELSEAVMRELKKRST